jgi:hypothetical protein
MRRYRARKRALFHTVAAVCDRLEAEIGESVFFAAVIASLRFAQALNLVAARLRRGFRGCTAVNELKAKAESFGLRTWCCNQGLRLKRN